MTYIAIAYRYGWSNGHWYIVAAGSVLANVSNAAIAEQSSRGGKYGIQVVSIDDSGEETAIEHHSSSRGESQPESCITQTVWEKVGHRVISKVEEGVAPTAEEIRDWMEYEKEVAKILTGGPR